MGTSKMKIAVSSHHLYYDKTRDVLHSSLISAGVPHSSVYYFVADPSVSLGKYLWEDENVCRIGQNSFDMNAYVSVVEQDLKADRWFFIHDTTFVGSNFYTTLLECDHSKKDVVSLLPWNKNPSMYMGSYSWDSLIQLKSLIVSDYKNESFDVSISNRFKTMLVQRESTGEIFLRTPYCYSTIEIKGVVTGHYGSSTPRVLEYYPDIDLYKLKANWFVKDTWTVQL